MSEGLLVEAERVHFMLRFPPGRHLVAAFKNSRGAIQIIHYFNQTDIPLSFVQRPESFLGKPDWYLCSWFLYSVKSLEEFERDQGKKKDGEAIERIVDRGALKNG